MKAYAWRAVDHDAAEIFPLPFHILWTCRKIQRGAAVALDDYSVLLFAFDEVGHVSFPVRLGGVCTTIGADCRRVSGGGSGGVA